MQQQLRKSIAADYENELRLLKQNSVENEERLKIARQKEFEFLKKEQELKAKEQELEILLQKKLFLFFLQLLFISIHLAKRLLKLFFIFLAYSLFSICRKHILNIYFSSTIRAFNIIGRHFYVDFVQINASFLNYLAYVEK